jgi:hypothetical protein
MTAKLTDGYVDYSQDRHLFVGKFISAEAQRNHAYKLVQNGSEGIVYVHYHSHLDRCVRECTKFTMTDHEVGVEPAFTFEDTDNEVAQESS